MKAIVIAFISSASILGCAQNDPDSTNDPFSDPFGEPDLTVQEDSTFKILPDPSGNVYFPEGQASYYTRYLAGMEEPSLQTDLEPGEELKFRFTYLRSFDDPIAVRFSKVGDMLKMRAVILKMRQDYSFDGVIHDETLEIDAAGRKELLTDIVHQEFWKPFNDAERFIEGLDGSTWVFEIHDKDGYRMIDPWSPKSKPFPDHIDLPKILKEAGFEGQPIRDYKIYVEVGYTLLRIADILPEPDQQY